MGYFPIKNYAKILTNTLKYPRISQFAAYGHFAGIGLHKNYLN